MVRIVRNIPAAVALLAAVALAWTPVLPTTALAAEPGTESAPAPEDRDAEPAGIRLARLTVCEDVQEREPVGERESYPSSVGALYCFTDVQGATDPPVQLFHRWYVGDRMVGEVPISVKGPRWRCWSRKTILPAWTGAGRVEILTDSGDVLGTVGFALE